MELRNPFKWAVLYRAVSVGALGLGLALVAGGFLVGFGGSITTLLADPLQPGPAIDQANPTITLVFVALGVVVWQLGKSYALFVTLPRAAGRAAGRQLDANRLASEVQDGLDDRLADIEAEISETRRAVQALEEDDRTVTFDEREHTEDEADAAGDEKTNATADGTAVSTARTTAGSDSISDPSPPSSPSDASSDANGDDDPLA